MSAIRKGFTLVELIVVLAIIALAATFGYQSLVVSSIKDNIRQTFVTENVIAGQIIESLDDGVNANSLETYDTTAASLANTYMTQYKLVTCVNSQYFTSNSDLWGKSFRIVFHGSDMYIVSGGSNMIVDTNCSDLGATGNTSSSKDDIISEYDLTSYNIQPILEKS